MSSRALVIQHRARPTASRSPRIAVTAVFVAHGLLFASWTAHIPHVMPHLGLTDGTLGIALLGAPVGSVAAMLVASYLIPRFGSRRVVQLTLVGSGLLTSRMLPDAIERPRADERPKTGTRSASRWSGGMVLLGAIAFAGMLCEGASADWASVYLSGPLHATGAVPGPGLCRLRARDGHRAAVGQPAAQALPAGPPSYRAGRGGDRRIRGRTRDRPSGGRDRVRGRRHPCVPCLA